MQTFFEIMFMGCFAIAIFSNLFILAKISFVHARCEIFQRQLIEQDEVLLELLKMCRANDRSLQNLTELSAKPIKPNNWDSIEKAFKRPAARIQTNE